MLLLVAGGAIWGGMRAYRAITATKDVVVPTAVVQRGDISLSVTAEGELRGGNSEVLTAPLTGGSDMHITSLGEDRRTGESRRRRRPVRYH